MVWILFVVIYLTYGISCILSHELTEKEKVVYYFKSLIEVTSYLVTLVLNISLCVLGFVRQQIVEDGIMYIAINRWLYSGLYAWLVYGLFLLRVIIEYVLVFGILRIKICLKVLWVLGYRLISLWKLAVVLPFKVTIKSLILCLQNVPKVFCSLFSLTCYVSQIPQVMANLEPEINTEQVKVNEAHPSIMSYGFYPLLITLICGNIIHRIMPSLGRYRMWGAALDQGIWGIPALITLTGFSFRGLGRTMLAQIKGQISPYIINEPLFQGVYNGPASSADQQTSNEGVEGRLILLSVFSILVIIILCLAILKLTEILFKKKEPVFYMGSNNPALVLNA